MKITRILFVLLLVLVVACASVLPNGKAEANLGEQATMVRISRDSNYVSYNNVAFPFNFKKFGLDSMWDAGDPTKITIRTAGVYLFGFDMTSLGLLYQCGVGIAPINAERAIYEIVKNWCGNEALCKHLDSDVLFNRFEIQNSWGANGNSGSTVGSFKEGDFLQMVTTGKYNGPNGTPALCIESNPSDGILSPSMWAVFLGALP